MMGQQARRSSRFCTWKGRTRKAQDSFSQLSNITILQDLIRSIRPPDQVTQTTPSGTTFRDIGVYQDAPNSSNTTTAHGRAELTSVAEIVVKDQ